MAHKRLIAMSPGGIVKRMESVQFVQSVWRRQLKSALSRKRQSPVLKCLALHAFHVVMFASDELPAASSSFQAQAERQSFRGAGYSAGRSAGWRQS